MRQTDVNLSGNAILRVTKGRRIGVNRIHLFQASHDPIGDFDPTLPEIRIQSLSELAEVVLSTAANDALYHQFKPVTIKVEDRTCQLIVLQPVVLYVRDEEIGGIEILLRHFSVRSCRKKHSSKHESLGTGPRVCALGGRGRFFKKRTSPSVCHPAPFAQDSTNLLARRTESAGMFAIDWLSTGSPK